MIVWSPDSLLIRQFELCLPPAHARSVPSFFWWMKLIAFNTWKIVRQWKMTGAQFGNRCKSAKFIQELIENRCMIFVARFMKRKSPCVQTKDALVSRVKNRNSRMQQAAHAVQPALGQPWCGQWSIFIVFSVNPWSAFWCNLVKVSLCLWRRWQKRSWVWLQSSSKV